jgi:hypothetical protein
LQVKHALNKRKDKFKLWLKSPNLPISVSRGRISLFNTFAIRQKHSTAITLGRCFIADATAKYLCVCALFFLQPMRGELIKLGACQQSAASTQSAGAIKSTANSQRKAIQAAVVFKLPDK